MTGEERSYERLTQNDLGRLAVIAREDQDARFARRPRWRPYADRVLCVALCQGAALHYVDGRNGVKDFDVYTSYAEHPTGPFPFRWRTAVDFGPSRFGRYPGDPESFSGRRVDLIGRSLDVPPDADPVEAVRRYLAAGRTETARQLAMKALVLLGPEGLRGEMIWPPATPVALADGGVTPAEKLAAWGFAESSDNSPAMASSLTCVARCRSATASGVVGTSSRDRRIPIGSRRPTTTRDSRCTEVTSLRTTSGSRIGSATAVTTHGGRRSTRCSVSGCRWMRSPRS